MEIKSLVDLKQLGIKYRTDKVQNGYLPFYDKLFQSRRLDDITFVEVGVLRGASHKMWRDYFPNGKVYVIDDYHQEWQGPIADKLLKEEGIKTFKADVNNREEMNEYTRKWVTNRKNLLKEKMGGKCVICGATENLQFDHINPLEKSYNISTNFFRQDVDEELAKCQLLCSRCHLEKTKNDWSSGVLTEKRGY